MNDGFSPLHSTHIETGDGQAKRTKIDVFGTKEYRTVAEQVAEAVGQILKDSPDHILTVTIAPVREIQPNDPTKARWLCFASYGRAMDARGFTPPFDVTNPHVRMSSHSPDIDTSVGEITDRQTGLKLYAERGFTFYYCSEPIDSYSWTTAGDHDGQNGAGFMTARRPLAALQEQFRHPIK